jgi:hypothetical protein
LNDVWYSFTVPENVATVDVSTDFLGGSLYDTEVAVYSGACDGLQEVGCDNDGGCCSTKWFFMEFIDY